jgi:asparagine synthase (glutamine-hydrolysing)
VRGVAPVREALIDSVRARLDGQTTQRDFGVLCSGGLDSSLILGIVCMLLHEQSILSAVSTAKKQSKEINVFSVQYDSGNSSGNSIVDSVDVVHARKLVAYLQEKYKDTLLLKHTVFSFTFQTAEALFKQLIYTLGTFDQTTIRASMPMFVMMRSIATTFPTVKVIFSGEMSDEVCGGYRYMLKAPNALEYTLETTKLLNSIHFFDNLRADRVISAFSIEARVPFSDTRFVDTFSSIPPTLRFGVQKQTGIEKYALRLAFDASGIIPNDIIWRTKEAFSDSVGSNWIRDIKKKYPSVEEENAFYRETFYRYYSRSITDIDVLGPSGLMWLPNQNWIDTQGESSAVCANLV